MKVTIKETDKYKLSIYRVKGEPLMRLWFILMKSASARNQDLQGW